MASSVLDPYIDDRSADIRLQCVHADKRFVVPLLIPDIDVSHISAALWCYIIYYTPSVLYTHCLFFLPLSHSAPSLPMFPLEFRNEVNHWETRVMGLSSSEDRMIVA